jgi:integrase/recombinase XerD
MDATLASFERELNLRGLSPITVGIYLGCARRLLEYHKRPVEDLTRADIKAYLHALWESGRHGALAQKQHTSAIRGLFRYCVEKPEVVAWLSTPKSPKRLPKTIPPEQIEAALSATDSERSRAIIMLGYGAGMRVSEVCNLQVRDIHTADGVIHVRAGKGNKDRLVVLSPRMLKQLRRYWPERRRRHPNADAGRPREYAWLFPNGRRSGRPVSRAWAARLWRRAQCQAGVTAPVGFHALRHAFAIGLLDSGADLRTVQLLLGHTRMETTARYLNLRPRHIGSVVSPLDHFGPRAPSE